MTRSKWPEWISIQNITLVVVIVTSFQLAWKLDDTKSTINVILRHLEHSMQTAKSTVLNQNQDEIEVITPRLQNETTADWMRRHTDAIAEAKASG